MGERLTKEERDCWQGERDDCSNDGRWYQRAQAVLEECDALERERDEARAELEGYRAVIATLRSELDEARQTIAELRSRDAGAPNMSEGADLAGLAMRDAGALSGESDDD